MASRRSLRRLILYWLGIYGVLLTAAIGLSGYLFNEYAEQLVWESLLRMELTHHLERRAADPDYQWRDTGNLRLHWPGKTKPLHPALAALPAGVHDDVPMDGREYAVLVEDRAGERFVLALDITELEQQEMVMSLVILAFVLALALLLGALVVWGVGRLLRPLFDMAGEIGRLKPDRAGQRIAVSDRGGSELVVIAEALNGYLERNEQFVERERVFIDSASHELRTPIAVIAGATELALGQPDLPAVARIQIARAYRTARDVEQLVSLLLVLARDPARLARTSDQVALDELLPEIVDDHRHLTRGKQLELVIQALPPCRITAPVSIVQAAVGNLLRNAIENSDQGQIHIRLLADATVVIEDPGHGMTPEEISRIYTQIARGGTRGGGGIGLDLLARLCEHLGWRLDIRSTPGKGTVSTLRLSESRAA